MKAVYGEQQEMKRIRIRLIATKGKPAINKKGAIFKRTHPADDVASECIQFPGSFSPKNQVL